jgi:hypothetical protein
VRGRGKKAEGPPADFTVLGRSENRTGGAGFLLSFFLFSNSSKTSNQVLNSNQGLNPNTQKQCTSMNATANSYISLIN